MEVPKSKATWHSVLNYQNCSSTAKHCSNIAKNNYTFLFLFQAFVLDTRICARKNKGD